MLQILWIRNTKRRPIKWGDSLSTINELGRIFFRRFSNLRSHAVHSVQKHYELSSFIDATQLKRWPSTLCLNIVFFSSSHWFSIYRWVGLFFYVNEYVLVSVCISLSASYRYFDSTFLLLLFSFTPSSDPLFTFNQMFFEKRGKRKCNENILAGDKNNS